MNRIGAGLLAALLLTAIVAPAARAEPTEVLVRTEGRTATLFEGAIVTDGHAVRAASDSAARRCDGTNNGANATPGPTPTAATVDAMAGIGQDFDGQWYPGFEDYFVTRFGPDAENAGAFEHWGLLVNRVFTSVGGCQYRLAAGDLAMWVYDAFNGRPLLRLDGPAGQGEPTAPSEGAPAAPVQRTFTVAAGAPFTVRAVASANGVDGPAAGVSVSPVATGANGVQTVLRSDPSTVVTDAGGRAVLSWSEPGWKRIKADADGHVRSNRLDVCVLAPGATGCADAPPPDTGVRTPPPSRVPEPAGGRPGSGSLVIERRGRGRELRAGGLRVSLPRITADGNPTGLVGVRWSVLDAGPGLRSLELHSRLAGSRWLRRFRGVAQRSALLDLPIGRVSSLRATATAATGESATAAFGSVVVPRDDRVRPLRFSGRRAQVKDPLAWRQTVTRLRRGGRLAVRLPAGRPALVVRGARRGARIGVVAGGRRRTLRVGARRDGATRFAVTGRRSRPGLVRFRVLRGTVDVDGVAVTP